MLRLLGKLLDSALKLQETYQFSKTVLGYLLGITVVPVVAIALIIRATGPVRVIGIGLLIYSLILLLVLVPFVVPEATMHKLAQTKRDFRFLIGIFLLMLTLPLYFYQQYTMTRFSWIGFSFTAVPICLLSLLLLGSWFYDILFSKDERLDVDHKDL